MKTKAKYQRHSRQLTVEFESEDLLFPRRRYVPVSNMRQAQLALMKFILMENRPVRRAWVTIYQYGNVTEAERYAAYEFWVHVPTVRGLLPPYRARQMFLLGSENDDQVS